MIISDTSRRGRRKRGRRVVTCAMCRSVRRKGYYGHLDCSSCLEKLPVCVACLSGNNSGRQELVQLACDVCENVVCTAGGCSTRCTDEACEVRLTTMSFLRGHYPLVASTGVDSLVMSLVVHGARRWLAGLRTNETFESHRNKKLYTRQNNKRPVGPCHEILDRKID